MYTKKMKKNISNLIYFFMFLIRIISGSNSNSNIREFVVVDVDSLKGELGLSNLSIAHDYFYSTYQSYMTGLVLHVRDSNGQIINTADSDYGVEIPSSRWKWQFLQNNTSIKQADQQLTSFGDFSESFTSTNSFAFAKFQTGPELLQVIFNGSYTDLVNEIISRNFDEVVGDTAITTNRYQRCDDKWRFLKPLTHELWLTSIALFVLTGAGVHTVGENGRDVNRLEYFSMVTFDPRHARDVLEFDDDGGGGGGGSAAGDQVLEMDTGARQRWWKKVWRLLLKQTTQH